MIRSALGLGIPIIVLLAVLAGGVGAGAATGVGTSVATGVDTPTATGVGTSAATGVETSAASEAVGNCTVLDEPGTYELDANLTTGATCIEITAADVLLDGGNHTITGQPGAEAAIDASGVANVSVRNLTVAGSGVDAGVRFASVENGTVTNATFVDVQTGLVVRESTDISVTNSTVTDGGDGIEIEGAANVTVASSAFRDGNHTAILITGTSGATVRNSTVADYESGILAYPGGDTTTDLSLVGNAIRDQEIGSVVIGSDVTGARLVDNDVRRNGKPLWIGGNDTALRGNDVIETGNENEDGSIVVEGATDVTLEGTYVTGYADSGVRIVDSRAVRVTNATSMDNPEWDLSVVGTSTNVTVEHLDVGASTAPNTTVSFTGEHVGVAANPTPPTAPDRSGLDRFVRVEPLAADGSLAADGYADLELHYDDGDLGNATEGELQLWATDGDWAPIGSTVDASGNVVRGNVTGPGTIGAFEQPDGPFFAVDVVETNHPIREGHRLNATVAVENVGTAAGTRNVTLTDVDGVERDAVTVSLASGASTERTVTWDTARDAAGEGSIAVRTPNHTATASVAVREADLDACAWITAPGEYELVDDVGGGGVCVMIAADDVVLEGGNHTIDGSAAGSTGMDYGVAALGTEPENVTVRNLTVTDAGSAGVMLSDAAEVELTDVRTVDGFTGITLRSGTNATVTGVESRRNDVAGLVVTDSSGLRVRNATVANNGGDGIVLGEGTAGTVLRNNTAVANGGAGIALEGAGGTRLEGNEVRGTSGVGIQVVSDDNRLSGTVIEGTSGPGIGVYGDGAVLEAVSVAGSDAAGIVVGGSDGRLEDVRAVDSTEGIDVRAGSTNTSILGATVRNGTEASLILEEGADDASVDRLDLGNSTAPNTTLSLTGEGMAIDAADAPPAGPGTDGIGRFFDATALDAADDPHLDVTLNYEEGDLAGVAEADLGLWRYDGNWTPVAADVDPDANRITAGISDFGTFGAFERPEDAVLAVEILDVTTPIPENGTLAVTASVTNLGGEPGEQTVTFRDVDGVVRDERSVALAPGERTELPLTWNTTPPDTGSGSVAVATANATATAEVQIGATQRITQCRVRIDQPGYYVVDGALQQTNSGPCILISDARNVVLAGNGHELSTTTGDFGVVVDSSERVTVRNLTVDGFSEGVIAADSTDVTIADVTANATTTGIRLDDTEATTVERATVHAGRGGVVLGGTTDTTVANATLRGGQHGLLVDGSDGTTVGNVDVAATGGSTDISVLDARNTQIADAFARGSGEWAIAVAEGSTNTTVETLDVQGANATNATVSFRGEGVRVGAAAEPVVPADDLVPAGRYVNVSLVDGGGFLELDVPYEDGALSGGVASDAGLRATDGGIWSVVPGSTVDANSNVVSGTVTRNATVGVFAPVPTDEGGDGDGGSNGGGGGSGPIAPPPQEPATFDVEIVDVPAMTVGEPATIEYAVENVGGEAATQTVTLTVDGTVVAEPSIALAPGGSANETVTYRPETVDAPAIDLAIASADASASERISVGTPAPPTFAVAIDEDRSDLSVAEGEAGTLVVSVENVGAVAGEQSVAVSLAGRPVTEETVALDAGESASLTVSYGLEDGDAPAVDLTVTTANRSVERTVDVADATADGGQADEPGDGGERDGSPDGNASTDDGGDGSPGFGVLAAIGVLALFAGGRLLGGRFDRQ